MNIEYCVISVIGSHAGESVLNIFARKIRDIEKLGITFWLIKSHKAKPQMVQEICSLAKAKSKPCYCLFIEASSKGGAVPTKIAATAKNYSKNGANWIDFPAGLSPVTGKVDAHAQALALHNLELTDMSIDLWDYADFFNQGKPIAILRGASTVCAVRKDVGNAESKIKSRYRKVLAIGILAEPYCAHIRN